MAAHLSDKAATEATLNGWRAQWAGHIARQVAWPWDVMVRDHRRRLPTRFEMALWSDDTLCGLAIGRTGAHYCSVEWLEGSPVPGHPLKGQVIPAVLTALLAYAIALGKTEMRLVEPLNELIPRYEARGFVLVLPKGKRRYCVRTVP